MNVATNGLIKIPYEGLEEMPLGIAIWGDTETDSCFDAGLEILRGRLALDA
jgi:hypothetical protein